MEEKETREYFERHIAASRIEIMGAAEHLCNELALVGETIVDLISALPEPWFLRGVAEVLELRGSLPESIVILREYANKAESAIRKAKGEA